MQVKTHYEDGRYYKCNIPNEDIEVIPGVLWGSVNIPFTPAYWRFTCIANDSEQNQSRYHLGSTLKEEVVACLLGGHGVTGELGLAAYHHLRHHDALNYLCSAEALETLLSEPLDIDGRLIKYRYPRQKARYIAAALLYLHTHTAPEHNGRILRDWLTAIPGIGNKTASWIARNWLDACDIAILDIHIHRAGVIAGIFSPNNNITREYLQMEEAFVDLADGIGISANVLDNQIWNELRQTPNIVRRMLIEHGVTTNARCGLPPARNRRTSRNYDLFVNA